MDLHQYAFCYTKPVLKRPATEIVSSPKVRFERVTLNLTIYKENN